MKIFAISSTVIDSQNNGYFNFTDSVIYNNYAVNIPVAKLFDSALTSEIHNTTIYENEAMTVDQVKAEVTGTCQKLCFLNTLFETKVLTDTNFAKYTYAEEIFQLIVSELDIDSATEIYSQKVPL